MTGVQYVQVEEGMEATERDPETGLSLLRKSS